MKNKERKLKAIIIILIITILILCMQLFLVKKGSINSKKQIIKEMSESEQVTDLNNQINELNTSHTEYMNYIQTCKTQIATALTNEGVATSDQATLETMAESISKVLQERTKDATATADNITDGKTAYVNGEKIVGTYIKEEDIKHTIRVDGNSRNGYSYIYVDGNYVKLLNPYNQDSWSIEI